MNEPDVVSSRDNVAFYLALAALFIAAGAHALVWSGGLLALPLAWLLAVVAIVVVASIHRRSSLTSRSWWGLGMAVVVLGGSLVEVAALTIRGAIE